MKKYLLQNKLASLVVLILSIVKTSFAIGNSLLLNQLVNFLTSRDVMHFWMLIAFQFGLYIVWSFLLPYFDYATENIAQKMNNSVRRDIVASLAEMEVSEFNKKKSSEYVSWLTNDITMISNEVFINFFDMVDMAVYVAFAAVTVFIYNSVLVVVMIVLAFAMLFVPRIFDKKLAKTVNDVSTANENLTKVSSDYLTGFSLLFHHERLSLLKEKIAESYEILRQKTMTNEKAQTVMATVLTLFSMLSQLAMSATAGYFVLRGDLTVGFVWTIGNLSGPFFNNLSSFTKFYAKVKANANLLDKFPKVAPRDVTSDYKFERQLVLENLAVVFDKKKISFPNLTFEHGKKYAITGQSGVGKSTLLKILAGDLTDYEGNVLADDKVYSALSSADIHGNLTYVEQSSHLFNESAVDNITLGVLDPDRLATSLSQAQAGDFSDKQIAELSGGKRNGFHLRKGFTMPNRYSS
ncbi:ABC transporter transmembrane domain-containing protein [Lactococcus insecticola]|uniref:ABC transporter ATP-binding protein n=1 Tax=Pseudolactococcus insecticola TaxID=2709158 RepID=A0A6A0B6Q6_9LACT|nr:ABC transporter ATP-binding protein [Lactococcus insecticola]GFH40363.1 ABC transporter ATP-binding protein [Lactococcus insecticola]